VHTTAIFACELIEMTLELAVLLVFTLNRQKELLKKGRSRRLSAEVDGEKVSTSIDYF
jgi:hypothetical protein